jgi:hypothetical protein
MEIKDIVFLTLESDGAFTAASKKVSRKSDAGKAEDKGFQFLL